MAGFRSIPEFIAKPMAERRRLQIRKSSAPRPLRSRVLCMRLMAEPKQAFGRHEADLAAISEAFLRFSPRLAARSDAWSGTDGGWIFLDLAAGVAARQALNSEIAAMDGALALARDMGFLASAAIANTFCGAQAFAAAQPMFVCPPRLEAEHLRCLPLPVLLQMEGVTPWPDPVAIANLVAFFREVDFNSIEDLLAMGVESLRERWGETGELVFRRIRGLEDVSVSEAQFDLVPIEPLRMRTRLDFPILMPSLLIHATRRPLDILFARLAGRRLNAERMSFSLYSENGRVWNAEHQVARPTRELATFFEWLEHKLLEFTFEQAVHFFDIAVDARPEQGQQLGFQL